MAKKVICFALGGHISSQNASFRKLAEILEPKGYRFYGAKDGFSAFETGEVYELSSKKIPRVFAGFVAGAGRSAIKTKPEGKGIEIEKAIDFFKRGNFDIAVGSGGDDHGKQMAILSKNLEGRLVYCLNKTMDNDLGGKDGIDNAPYTDFTNGFHTAVSIGVKTVKNHFSGAWTNNCPYLIGHFGREANWVGIAMAYWGCADKIIYGELQEGEAHSLEKIHQIILDAQSENEKKYGRRFAMIIVPEGTRITGMKHTADLFDIHGHHKLQPEVLVTELKTELEKQFKMKTQTAGITYEMRNFPPTKKDILFAEDSAAIIANAIERGEGGLESVFKIRLGEVLFDTAQIEKVSEKRYSSYYPKSLINLEKFEVTEEIGRYYYNLFGKKVKPNLPGKLKSVII